MTGRDRSSPGLPIAVVAVGAMFPGRGTTEGFYRDLIEGVDAVGDVPETHWSIGDYFDPDPAAIDKTYGKRGGFLTPQAFDPIRFGLPPTAIASTDTSQLLALMVADRVLSDVEAAIGDRMNRERTSVILGVASATELTGHMAARLQRPVWERALRVNGLDDGQVTKIADTMSACYTEWTEATFPGLLGNVVAGRIANRLNLGGSNFVTDAACASSLSALHCAVHELRSGASDMALAGGADALNDILMYLCFSKTPALSPTGDCRPFSDKADGTILGEGIGMVALKRLTDAERDGDRVHAVIKGIGGASDGQGTAIYAPLASGQAKALRRAYEDAGYGPETVGLVEAHGTGTQAGDKAELEGLTSVFSGGHQVDRPWCALGSVKSQIGHTKAAAGAASLIKTVMALSRKVIPPTIKIETPASTLQSGSPFYLTTEAQPWVQDPAKPRRASVSSFGFGGSNFHVTLEAYRGPNQPIRPRLWPAELILFSASDRSNLADDIVSTRDKLTADTDLPHLAEEAARRFDPAAAVTAYIVSGSKSAYCKAAEALLEHLSTTSSRPKPLPVGVGLRDTPVLGGKVAFLFAGQGSQYVGMGRDLALAMPAALKAWTQAAGHPVTGSLDLHTKAFPPTLFGDAAEDEARDELTRMVHAQPGIAVSALSQLDALSGLGIDADMAGGHSFGELLALYHGGAMNRQSLLTLSHARATAMTDAARGSDGAMLAVRASMEDLQPMLDDIPGVALANDNGPSQVALSGATKAIEAAQAKLSARGYAAHRLPVASAFHSPIVASAVTPFGNSINTVAFKPLTVPVYANVTGRPYGGSPEHNKRILANQIQSPVRFREMIEAMYADGARTFLEIGPNSVVSGLVKDVLATRPANIVALDRKRGDSMVAFLGALGSLAISGQVIDFQRLYADNPAPAQPPQRPRLAVDICGANYGKPNPPERPETLERTEPPAPPAKDQLKGAASESPIVQSRPKPEVLRQLTPTEPYPMQTSVESTPAMPHRSALELAINEISRSHRHYMDLMAQMVRGASEGASFTEMPDAPAIVAAERTQNGSNGTQGLNGEFDGANGASTPLNTRVTVSQGKSVNSSNGHTLNGLSGQTNLTDAAVNPDPRPSPPQGQVVIDPGDSELQTHREAAHTPSQNDAEFDIKIALIEIISEKTGYPKDMLDSSMHLESELGIDSIKQVEILSAIKDRYPALPEIDPEDMADLTTIEAIASHFDTALGKDSNSSGDVSDRATAKNESNSNGQTRNGAQAPAKAANAQSGQAEIEAVLKSIISEKTGYPVEMLENDMDLEAELGIDSIKQVEILSALGDMRPDLPSLDPDAMADLRSIADLVRFFS
ncbi:MAG: beta-ketoacyl synthase N-terminal-like domain-containing protein [Pseudomonadota bacterium]